MLVNHKTILNKISTYKGHIAIWGVSSVTKEFFNKYPRLVNTVDCIIDNDINLQGQIFKHKPIVSFEDSLQKKDLLIILFGNHVLEIVSQMKDKEFVNFLIDYEYSENYFQKNLVIEIDYVYYDRVIKFCDAVVEYCKKNALECHIKPYKYSNWPMHETKEYVFNKIVAADINPPKNTLIFSTHTIGESNPQILRWKIGYLDKTITFDDRGYSGWSSLANNPDVIYDRNYKKIIVEKNFKKLEKKYISKNISKYKQENNPFIFPEKFIFFPLQIFQDTVMLQSNFEPLILFKTVVEILNKKGIPLVVKRHPLCTDKLLEDLLIKYTNENKIFLFNGSIHDAISKASTIYVINSGVGFEALMHLKPVVSFGKSDYMSVTRHIINLEQIDENPWYILDEEEKDKIKLFLHYFINEKCIDLFNKKDIRKKIASFVVNYVNKEYYENK